MKYLVIIEKGFITTPRGHFCSKEAPDAYIFKNLTQAKEVALFVKGKVIQDYGLESEQLMADYSQIERKV